MNERIKELAEKAGFVLWGNEEWGPGEGHVDWSCDYEDALVKYTELIVKECIAQCEQVAADAHAIVKSKFVTDTGCILHEGMWGGAKNCGGQIREHFGVDNEQI